MAKVKKAPKNRRTSQQVADADTKEDTQDQEESKESTQAPLEETTYARSPQGLKAERERQKYQREQEQYAANKAAADEAERQEAAKAPNATREPGTLKSYLLLSGTHEEAGVKYTYQRDGRVVVKSPFPLDAMFMNKFRCLDGETSPGRDFRDTFDRPGLVDPPLAEARPNGFKTQLSSDSVAAQELQKLRAENAKLKAQLGIDEDEDEDDNEEEEAVAEE